jgi:hypothetical protein
MWKQGMLSGHYEIRTDKRTLKDNEVWDYLDELGKERWEMVSAVPEIAGHGASGSSTDGYMIWFKRSIEG